MTAYWRPLVRFGPGRPEYALPLAGGPGWFDRVEKLTRDAPPAVMPAAELPQDWLSRLTEARPPIAVLKWDRPQIMAILNVTPDSFSDGGQHAGTDAAVAAARAMVVSGADLIDIGGESTRPGAKPVPVDEEIARVEPVISAMAGPERPPISIDTRKAAVAEAALAAGAALVNDVSGFTHDPALAPLCAGRGAPVCVMHSQGDPETMQTDPRYDDVLLDVYDWLEQRIIELESQGIPRARIVADPGIGFGKTRAHNLALLRRIGLFHGLGVPILLGASRKGFIGAIGGAPDPAQRLPGSLAVALAAVAQGVQIVRVHDVAETAQALALWHALHSEGESG